MSRESRDTGQPLKIEGCPDCNAIFSMMEPGGITSWGCSNPFHSRGRKSRGVEEVSPAPTAGQFRKEQQSAVKYSCEADSLFWNDKRVQDYVDLVVKAAEAEVRELKARVSGVEFL